jgi:hypothetical protein
VLTHAAFSLTLICVVDVVDYSALGLLSAPLRNTLGGDQLVEPIDLAFARLQPELV